MTEYISPRALQGSPGQMAGTLREAFSLHELGDFRFVRADRPAAAVCEIDVELVLDGGDEAARMRWIHEADDGSTALPGGDGKWFLYLWDPWVMIGRAS